MELKCRIYKCGKMHADAVDLGEIRIGTLAKLGKDSTLHDANDKIAIKSQNIGIINYLNTNHLELTNDPGNDYYGFNLRITKEEFFAKNFNAYIGSHTYLMFILDEYWYLHLFNGCQETKVITISAGKDYTLGSDINQVIKITDDDGLYKSHLKCSLTKENRIKIEPISEFTEVYVSDNCHYKFHVDVESNYYDVRLGQNSYLQLEIVYPELFSVVTQTKCIACNKYSRNLIQFKSCSDCYLCPLHMEQTCKLLLSGPHSIYPSNDEYKCEKCGNRVAFEEIVDCLMKSKVDNFSNAE